MIPILVPSLIVDSDNFNSLSSLFIGRLLTTALFVSTIVASGGVAVVSRTRFSTFLVLAATCSVVVSGAVIL